MIKLSVNSNFFLELKKLFENAKEKICIIIYNWHFYHDDLANNTSQLNQILFLKLKSGVKIKVVVGNLTLYNQLKEFGLDVRYNRVRGLNHAKVVVIDNKIATVGSHNFSENAWSRNEEASIISDDIDFVNECQNYFDITFRNCN